jgi:hypothetical protein
VYSASGTDAPFGEQDKSAIATNSPSDAKRIIL